MEKNANRTTHNDGIKSLKMLVADSIKPVVDSRENSVSSIRLPNSLIVHDKDSESEVPDSSARKIATASIVNKSMTYKNPH